MPCPVLQVMTSIHLTVNNSPLIQLFFQSPCNRNPHRHRFQILLLYRKTELRSKEESRMCDYCCWTLLQSVQQGFVHNHRMSADCCRPCVRRSRKKKRGHLVTFCEKGGHFQMCIYHCSVMRLVEQAKSDMNVQLCIREHWNSFYYNKLDI